MRKISFKRNAALLFVWALCLQFACTTGKFRQPILQFQAAAAVVTANTRSSLTEINRLEIARVLNERRRDGRDITGNVIEGAKRISKADLQVRLDALDRLNDYTDLLVQIANSDNPDNIAKSAMSLRGAIANLSNTVNGLTGNSNTKFKGAFNVAGTVVSEILRVIAQKKIREGLIKAIQRGDQPINDLIDAISADLTVIYKVRETGLKETEQNLIEQYGLVNDEYQKLSSAYQKEVKKESRIRDNQILVDVSVRMSSLSPQLDDWTARIITNRNDIEILASADPHEALNNMKQAHTKIVKYANENSPASFADAVEAIEGFVAAAKRLGDAVQELKAEK